MWRKHFYLGTILCVVFVFVFVSVVSAATTTETKKYSEATNLGLFGSHTWDIAVDPTDNSYVYIATYYSPNGFFYSSDGGSSWSGLPAGTDHGAGRAVEVNPNNGNVYALLNDLLVSDDHGVTYTTIDQFGTGASDMLYARGALFVAVNDEVYVSTDEGTNFSSATVCSDETVWSLAADATNVYAKCHNYSSNTDSLYISADSGTTWANLDIATDGITTAESVKVNPVTGHLFLIPSSTGGSTYRSEDYGATWETLSSAPISGNMNFDSNGRIYVGWNYSDDNGDTWSDFGTGGSYNHIIYPDPTDPTILYDTSAPGFLKSIDSGTTWTASVENITGVEVTSMSQTTDKDTVWVATQNGPAKTNNFTSEEADWSYSSMGNNFMSSGYDGVWVSPSDPLIAVYSSSMSISYTIDGGTTWTSSTVDITLPGAVFQIVSDSDGVLYGAAGPNTSTGSGGGIITSSDNGATWTSMSFPGNSATRSIAVASDGDIFVGAHSTLGGMYKYDGSSWEKLSAPDDFEYISVIVDPDDVNTIYALSSENGFYKSTDDGGSWIKSNSGLGKTDNYTEFNALTVQTSTNPKTLYLSGVKSSTNKGVIYKSADAGATWDLYYTGMRSEIFNALLFDGLLAGNSRGLFDMKSRAVLKLTANKKKVASGNKARFTVSLKDKATNKKLKNKRIKLYKKIGKKSKKYWKTVKLNKNGKKNLNVTVNKKTKLFAKWKMNANQREEYTSPGTKTKTIKLRK